MDQRIALFLFDEAQPFRGFYSQFSAAARGHATVESFHVSIDQWTTCVANHEALLRLTLERDYGRTKIGWLGRIMGVPTRLVLHSSLWEPNKCMATFLYPEPV